MKRTFKNKFAVYILVIIILDLIIGYFLFKSRLFSHLAIWNIIEFDKQKDFYWKPEDAPQYFQFEPYGDRIVSFKKEIAPLIKNKKNQWEIILKIAKYAMGKSPDNNRSCTLLKWDSPEVMLRQMEEGASANCFHHSILFSTYLSSLGIKSRLWALENEKFNGRGHTITEVYIENLRKWVFIDIMLDFYVTENDSPLSLLELREKLLDYRKKTVLYHSLFDATEKQKKIPVFYTRLIKCIFLRANNDFVNKYDTRYGIFSAFQRHLDKLPDKVRRGLEYLLGRQHVFIHYVDRYSRSLKLEIITAKIFFYLFAFSLFFIAVTLVILSVAFLKNRLFKNLSKKETRHR